MAASVTRLTSGTFRSSTYTTLYTVPAAKKLSAIHFVLGMTETTGFYHTVALSGGNYTTAQPILRTDTFTTAAGMTGAGYRYSTPCNLPASGLVRIKSNGAVTTRHLLHGILEDA